MPNFSNKDILARFNAGFLSARIGEWLFAVALNWIVFVQTESPLLLAVINACRLLPNLVLSLPAGKAADRYCRLSLNLWASILNIGLTAAVGISLCWGAPFWISAAFVTLRAAVTAAEAPWRNAYLCGLFEGDTLKSAVAQNASVMNLGRIIGPVLAGAVLSRGGDFLSFALSCLAVLAYSLTLNTLPTGANSRCTAKKSANKASLFQTIRNNNSLKNLLVLAVPVMFFGFPFTAMLPVVTEKLLQLGSQKFGILLAISACGALAASYLLGLRPESISWESTKTNAILFGFSLLGLPLLQNFWQAAFLLFWIGFLGQSYRSSSRMLYQDLIPREQAGTLLGLAFMDRGLIPLGALFVGTLAESFGPQLGIASMGFGCLMTLGFILPRRARRLNLALGSTTLVAIVVLLSGCQNHQSAPPDAQSLVETKKVEHAWGTTEVPVKPKRIVVLDLPFLDALTALKQPVLGYAGMADQQLPSYLAPLLKGELLPKFIGERKQPNLELILSLEPDLVVANPDRHKMIRQQLEEIAPTIALQDNSVQDIETMLTTFALICSREEEGARAISELQMAIEHASNGSLTGKSVLVIGSFEDEFSTWTQGSFIASLLNSLGANYGFSGPPSASESQTEVAKVTVDSLAEIDPDYIFVYGHPEKWADNPIYNGLKAVENGNALTVDRNLWSRARGPLAAQFILMELKVFLTDTQAMSEPKGP